VAFEVKTLRPYYEQWVSAHAGPRAVGVTPVDQRRFRGLVRLIEVYAESREIAVPEWNRDVPVQQSVRWSADDLDALSNLLRSVRDRMRAAGDPKLDAIAFGIAR